MGQIMSKCFQRVSEERQSSLPFNMNPEVTSSRMGKFPWLENSSEELLQDNRQFSQIVNKNRVALTEIIDLPKMWRHLRQLYVVDADDQARIKLDKTECEQVEALLDLLQKKPMWKLHGLFKALCDSGQDHIVRRLGLQTETYQGNDDTPAGTPLQGIERTNQLGAAQEEKQQLPPEVQKGIEGHQDYYFKTLMKGHLFDIEEYDLPYDMENCYIQIVATSDEQLVNPKGIDPDKAMSADSGKPPLKSAVLQGPPGAGKSSFVRRYAYKWSAPTKGNETEEQKKWDLVVVLPISTLRLSPEKSPKDQIFEAIKLNLAGSEVEAIMKHIEHNQMKVLIIPDGLDECRSETTLRMLKYLVEQCHKNVLPFSVFVTCRSGLCSIKQSLFERRMTIDGFTLDQGIEYVKKYYSEIKKPDDDTMLEYISNSRGKLDHILENPLRAHILSVVTADGTLKLKKGQTLSLKELLKAMEVSMKRRQLEKGKKAAESSQETLHEEDGIEAQTNNFYKLSLYSLLNDIRVFDDHLLKKFSVCNVSPYLSFMKRKGTHNIISGKVSEWHFTHEMFHEYLATRALESLPTDDLEYFLLHICSRPKFRNTQRILFSALGEDLDYADILADMLKATVLLQSKTKISDISKKVGSITEDTDPLEIILPEGKASVLDDTGSKDERASTVAILWKDIRSFFTNKAVTSRDIFVHMSQDKHLLSHIYECLGEVPEETQQRLFDNSIGRLLPLADGNTTWYATGHMRWSNITEDSNGLKMHFWSMADACDLVRQYGQHDDTNHQLPKQTQGINYKERAADGWSRAVTGIRHVGKIKIYLPFEDKTFAGFKGPWGDRPDKEFQSPQAWSELVGEMSRQWRIQADQLLIQWSNKPRDTDSPSFMKPLVRRNLPNVQGFLYALLQNGIQNYLKQLLMERENGRRDVIVYQTVFDCHKMYEWIKRYTNQSVLTVRIQNEDEERYTTWYATGETNLSHIMEDTDSLTIHSVSPFDAVQLIQQHGQPHHPHWTTQHDDTDQQEPQQAQVVTRQDRGADGRNRASTGIRHVRSIDVHIPSAGEKTSYSDYSDCWGDPSEQLLSTQAWSEMLGEMSQQWRIRADDLVIWWDKSCPISVKGLLDALLLEDTQHYLKQLLVEQEGGWRDVRVGRGNIDSSDLCEWTRRYTQQITIKVRFEDLICTIRLLSDSSMAHHGIADYSHEPSKKLLQYQASGLCAWHVMDGCRWSTMREEWLGLTLHAWSPVDACQLIQHHGQPHHPEWTVQHDDTDQQESQQTQVVTRQDGGADSRSRATTGIRHVWRINVHIPTAGEETSFSDYSACWGDPSEQLLSPQAWSEMLGEMSRQWRIRAGRLEIWWDKNCPISVRGLLDALLLEDTQHYLKQLLVERGWRDVIVKYGNIDSSDLCEWTRCYTQQSVVTVVLRDLHCKIREEEGSSREDQLAAVIALEDTEHRGSGLFYKMKVF